jgi:hypothetical protein
MTHTKRIEVIKSKEIKNGFKVCNGKNRRIKIIFIDFMAQNLIQATKNKLKCDLR